MIMNVIFRTNQQEWRDASLAKKELKFFKKKQALGIKKFDEAIAKEEAIIRSFMDKNRAA